MHVPRMVKPSQHIADGRHPISRSSISRESRDVRSHGEVSRDKRGISRETCGLPERHKLKSSEVKLEDFEDGTKSRLSTNSSSVYLERHTSRNSERAVVVLRSVVDDTIRDLQQRSKRLEAVIKKRERRILQSVQENINNEMDISTAYTGTSDLFKLLDRRNSRKLLSGGGPPVDYKEFMFFDRNSAKHLYYAINTLGDPSFNISYSRDYNAIAINPEMIGETGKSIGQFHGPTSVTGDLRNMYVCDSSNCRVVAYYNNKPLYTIGQKGKGPRDLDRPKCIAVDEMGTMFIADSFNDRVCVYSIEGEWKFNVGGRGSMNKPRGIACTKDGNTFVVSDTGNQKIRVFSEVGTHRGDLNAEFGKLGVKGGQFVRPQGITINNNKVYVCDSFNYNVQIFDIQGTLLGSIGEEGSSPGKFREPRDIAIDCNGNVLVTDTGKHTLQIFDKDGTFIREYGKKGNGVHEFHCPEGVHADPINRVFVADRKNNRIQVL